MHAPIDWLLAGEAWIVYRTRLDLLGESPTNARVRAARTAMLEDARVRELIAGLGNWPGEVIASHKSAGQPFHRLTFAADLGLTTDDPGVSQIVARVMRHRAPEGPFQLPMRIPEHFGGSGREEWAWALCDAPLVVYALAGFGLSEAPDVRRALDHLAGLVRANGWPCAVSKELGRFRGPGRKADPCPFANLAMLKALSAFEEGRSGDAARAGAEAMLALWHASHTQHPYQFYMGTDFRKLKVPFVWYDLMHVLDVLTRFAWLRGDARLRDMLDVMTAKADDQGRFTLESVWTAWRGWEFDHKREPSRWLTLAAWRIAQRMAM